MLQRVDKRNDHFDEPNEYRVLRVVRDSKVISRTEIAQLCRLSKPTVSNIVNRFLKHGFLERAGESESTDRGGRRRELLQFNPRAGFVVGVDVGMTECLVAITDLNAEVLERCSFTYEAGSTPEIVLAGIFRCVDAFLGSPVYPSDKCVGIGIGLPGLIDRATGIIKVADTLAGWQGVNLRQAFEDRFALPTYIENDVKARALAEFLFGVGKGIQSQVFLWIGDGIGAGIIIDGKLLHGITESAGEVGYNELGHAMTNADAYPLLYAGQRDFGEILSNSVIMSSYRGQANGQPIGSIGDIFRAADRGEVLAQRLLEEVASVTGIVCVNLINTLNPELIVIGGQIAEVGVRVLERVQQKVRADILSVPAEAVRIAPAALQENGVILGAAGLVLYDLFKPVPSRTPLTKNSDVLRNRREAVA